MRKYQQIFVDVDTQNDFLDPRGALFIKDSAAILENLAALTRFAVDRGIPVLASACAHLEDDAEFKQFPRHCVVDTWGQLKLAGTLLPKRITISADLPVADPAKLLDGRQQLILQKHAFDVFSNPAADALVAGVAADRFIIYGVATDYCVAAWCEGLLKRGRKIALVTDAIRAVDSRQGAQIIRSLCARGAATVTTAEVTGGAK